MARAAADVRRAASQLAAPQAEPDWSDREAVIQFIVDGERPYAGSVAATDEEMSPAARVLGPLVEHRVEHDEPLALGRRRALALTASAA